MTVSPAGTPVPETKNRPSASFCSTLMRQRAMQATESAFSCAKRSGATTGLGWRACEAVQPAARCTRLGTTPRTCGVLSGDACS